MLFLPGKKVFPRRTKEIQKKKTPLGIEPTTYGYNSNPMVTFHGGAGRLSRGIGQFISDDDTMDDSKIQ
jgi:hypothetical protein